MVKTGDPSPLTVMVLWFLQMFVALIFWYQFYCGFSGSAMIDQWYLIFFNLMFSAFPQLVTGTLDKDVSSETLQRLPQLYRSGQNSEVSPTVMSQRNPLDLRDGAAAAESKISAFLHEVWWRRRRRQWSL